MNESLTLPISVPSFAAYYAPVEKGKVRLEEEKGRMKMKGSMMIMMMMCDAMR